jgi:hypothetical protein
MAIVENVEVSFMAGCSFLYPESVADLAIENYLESYHIVYFYLVLSLSQLFAGLFSLAHYKKYINEYLLSLNIFLSWCFLKQKGLIIYRT